MMELYLNGGLCRIIKTIRDTEFGDTEYVLQIPVTNEADGERLIAEIKKIRKITSTLRSTLKELMLE